MAKVVDHNKCKERDGNWDLTTGLSFLVGEADEKRNLYLFCCVIILLGFIVPVWWLTLHNSVMQQVLNWKRSICALFLPVDQDEPTMKRSETPTSRRNWECILQTCWLRYHMTSCLDWLRKALFEYRKCDNWIGTYT